MKKLMITMKLPEQVISRVDKLARSLGLSRTAIIGMCTRVGLPEIEQFGESVVRKKFQDSQQASLPGLNDDFANRMAGQAGDTVFTPPPLK